VPDSSDRTTPERALIVLIADDAQARDVVNRLSDENADVRCVADLRTLDADFGPFSAGEPSVVLFDLERCGGTDDEVARALRRRFPGAALVALAGELGAERAARLLAQGVPSLKKPVSGDVLSVLALRLFEIGRESGKIEAAASSERTGRLDAFLEAYSAERGLSPQQRAILRLHLAGNNDKEIASACACSEATVYEHWRRMARKAGGMHKGCVLTDFHRFLDDS
jgi:DNA-binding NarL/FixJ family response regulator